MKACVNCEDVITSECLCRFEERITRLGVELQTLLGFVKIVKERLDHNKEAGNEWARFAVDGVIHREARALVKGPIKESTDSQIRCQCPPYVACSRCR